MKINDVTDLVADENDTIRRHEDIKYIMIHRIDVGEAGQDVAAAFHNNPGWIGVPYMPYTFIVRKDGQVDQCLPVDIVAPHALLWNRQAISVGVIGDFRSHPPTDEQLDSLDCLCDLLADFFGVPLANIIGHTEANNTGLKATNDPTKECPGRRLNMDNLRDRIELSRYGNAYDGLIFYGAKL